MARIKGVDIPDNKSAEISLTYIFGIGKTISNKILEKAKVNKDTKIKDLSEDELNRIRDLVGSEETEGDLRRRVSMDISNEKAINSYRGNRHKKSLPVRGQNTRSNAKTRRGKGKTVANKKK